MSRVLLACCLAALLLAAAAAEPLAILRGDGVTVHLDVEVAATPEARRRGLMGRHALPRHGGMWFDFGKTRPVAMWMKDTPLALDMLFFDAQARLVHVHAGAEPYSLAHVRAPVPVRYVLELRAGDAARLALTAGDRAARVPPVTASPRAPGSR